MRNISKLIKENSHKLQPSVGFIQVLGSVAFSEEKSKADPYDTQSIRCVLTF